MPHYAEFRGWTSSLLSSYQLHYDVCLCLPIAARVFGFNLNPQKGAFLLFLLDLTNNETE
jgi:hypothetical protein